MCFNGATPNIEPLIIHCVHLLYIAISNESMPDEGKMNALEEKKNLSSFVAVNDKFIPFSYARYFSCFVFVRPVEWLCSGFGFSFNANDSNLIQYLVYLNRILKMTLIVSGAIALLVSSFLFFQLNSNIYFFSTNASQRTTFLFPNHDNDMTLSLSSYPIWHNRMAELLRPYLMIYIIRQVGFNSIALIARRVHDCPSRVRKFYQTKTFKIIPISIYFL